MIITTGVPFNLKEIPYRKMSTMKIKSFSLDIKSFCSQSFMLYHKSEKFSYFLDVSSKTKFSSDSHRVTNLVSVTGSLDPFLALAVDSPSPTLDLVAD